MEKIPRRNFRPAIAIFLVSAMIALSADARNTPETEPNNSFATAIDVISDNVTYNGTLNPSDNADMYKVLLNRTDTTVERVDASLNKSSGGAVRMYIYDEQGYRLGWNGTNASGEVNAGASAPYTGYVYIVVLLWASNIGADYELTLNKTNLSVPDGALDANNRLSDAPAASSGYTCTTAQSELYNAADFYLVNLGVQSGSRDVLTVFARPAPTLDVVIELYRPGNSSYVSVQDEGTIFDPDYGTDETLYFVPPEGGDYIIRTWAEHGAGLCNISIRIFRGWSDNDNDFANSTAIDGDGLLNGNLSLNYDTEDYYKMYLRHDATINVTLSVISYDTASGLPNLNLWILDTDHNLVNSSAVSDPLEKAGATITRAGWYYIRVGAARNSAGDYSLNITTIQPPLVISPEGAIVLDEDSTSMVDLATVFSDQSSRQLVYSFVPALHLELGLNGSKLTLRPHPDWNGREVVAVCATNPDQRVANAVINVTVRPVNDPPVPLHANLNFSAPEDNPYILPVSIYSLFDDPDGETLEFGMERAVNLNVTIDENGTITAIPAPDWNGQETFTIIAADPQDATASVNVTIKVTAVNDAPVAENAPANISFEEDRSATIALATIFRDADGDFLAYTYSGGLLLTVQIQNGTAFLKTAYPDDFGADSLTFIAKDPSNATASFTVNVTVNPVNDPPALLRPIPNQSIPEDRVTVPFNLNSYFRDPDRENITFRATGPVRIGVAIAPDGWVTLSPSANWSGSEAILFIAEDGDNTRATFLCNITVEAIDDEPVLLQGSVTPARGNTGTKFTFTVLVRDIDSPAVVVKLVLGRRTLRMERIAGNLNEGAIYQVKTTLSEGDNPFYFAADDSEKSSVTTSLAVKVDGQQVDNTLLYLGLAVLTVVIIIAALVFTPTKKGKKWEDYEEE